LEVVVVDDKSPYGQEIRKLCSRFNVQYVRNDARGVSESQRALCLDLGFRHSTADIVVCLDADIIIPTGGIEKHIAYHDRPKVAVVGQIWSIEERENSVDRLNDFSEGNLMQLGKWRPHADVPWSNVGSVRTSDNWWALLGGHCSFRREELDEIGGWDTSYTGWGVEDNDVGYRAHKRGYSFIYAEDIKAFHIDHQMTRQEYLAKCSSALRNLRLFVSRYPETARDPRVEARLRELEHIVAGVSPVEGRQPTAGGGTIKEAT
jgi:GT2 family glycosyltransferase